jgi:hypothetical protein
MCFPERGHFATHLVELGPFAAFRASNSTNTMTTKIATITSRLANYRDLTNSLNNLRVTCGSHDLDKIERVLAVAFSHSDRDLGWRAAMRFVGSNWSWFETNTFLAPVLRQAMDGEVERSRRIFMARDERDAFERLPNHIKLHRGGGRTTVMHGLCWSLSSKVAEDFAHMACGMRRRMFRMGQINPVVVEATVPKNHCFAVKLGRNEEEVIVLPGPHVCVTHIRAVKQDLTA